MKMKRIKTTKSTMSILSLQEDQARKFIESRDHLLALNALFDAAKKGELCRNMARKIYCSDVMKTNKNKQNQAEKTAH